MGIVISLALTGQTGAIGQPISATLAPVFDTASAGDMLGPAVEPGIFMSSSGAIVSALAYVEVNGSYEPLGLSYLANHNDTIRIYIDVLDSAGNRRIYDLGTQLIAHAPPSVIGVGIADELGLQANVTPPTKNISAAFGGNGLTINLVAGALPAGQSFDGTGINGTPSAQSTGSATFSATNDSTIAVSAGYNWAVASPAPTAPGAFTANQWSVAPVPAGAALDITIITLPPGNGAAISLVEYRLDGGAWTDTGITGPGAFQITGLTNGTPVTIELRAVNTAGPAPASDLKPASPADTTPPVLANLTVDAAAQTLTMIHDEPVTLIWVRYGTAQVWAGADDQAKGAALEAALATAPDGGSISVPAVGTYTIDFTGLAAGDYYISYVKKDIAGNYSAIFQELASFPDTTSGGA